MEKRKKLYWIIKIYKPLLIIIAIAGLLYWFKFYPVDVTEYKVSKGTIINTVMGTGTLDAKKKVTISSKISGRIKEIKVDQGDKVKAGQLIVLLEEEELKMQVEVAEANMKTAKSSIKKLEYDFKYVKAVLDNAEKEYKRQLKLIAKNAISQRNFDNSLESFKVAKANCNRAKSAIIEGKMRVIETQKNVDFCNAQLNYTQIHAPFDGIIVFRTRDIGDVVVPGSPILSLVSTNILWVEAWVGETELEKIRINQPAKVLFRSFPKVKLPGKVARLAKEVDKETREFIVNVSVEKLPLNWAIGQRAEVYIETAKKNNVILIPDSFIKWHNNKTGVFLYDNGRAKWTLVKQGLQGNGMIEIISGIQEGNIILQPLNSKTPLTNNRRVSLK